MHKGSISFNLYSVYIVVFLADKCDCDLKKKTNKCEICSLSSCVLTSICSVFVQWIRVNNKRCVCSTDFLLLNSRRFCTNIDSLLMPLNLQTLSL